jgi:alkanesulfonate monooxygenase SsuD/methylene tetrahydromethanopterin reductase-like flavin-dependent oxidoreductase (luciferase family)
VRFGIFSNGKRHGKPASQGYDDDIAEILVAEECGFHEAWISEHIGVHRPATLPAPELLIAKAAALTKEIKFGVGVRLLPLYHPIDVAATAATLDHLTKGRYLFGFGGGGPTSGMEQRGLDRRDRHAMMMESLQLIIRCWTATEPFDYEGRFYRGERIWVLPKPFQQPYPPMAVASGSDEFLELAGREGYSVFNSHFDSPENFNKKARLYLDAAAAAGRTRDRRKLTMIRQIYCADSVQEALDDLREGADHELEEDIRFFGDRHLRNFMPPSGRLEDVSFDQLAAKGWFILGTPNEVCAQLRDLWERSGGFGTLLLTMGRDWSTPEKVARSMRLFAEHVAPRLASLEPAGETAAAAA